MPTNRRVLKLFQTKDNYRLVGATQMKMTAKNMRHGSSPENGKWISEDRWPSRVDKEERGFYILHVDSALEPGEYAVVLRPVKGYKQSRPASAATLRSSIPYGISAFPAQSRTTAKRKRRSSSVTWLFGRLFTAARSTRPRPR